MHSAILVSPWKAVGRAVAAGTAALLLTLSLPGAAWATAPIVDGGPNRTMYPGQSIVLHGTASDPDGGTSFEWQWEVVQGPFEHDGVLANAYTSDPTFTATVLGQYTVAVVVIDIGFEESASDYLLIDVVENFPPEAVLAASVTEGPAPLTVTFDASGSSDANGDALLFGWDFGDSESSNGAVVQHTYEMPGTYTAILTVQDSGGLTDFDTLVITVTAANAPPEAAPTATPNSGYAPLDVQFAANASDPDGDPLTYAWDFADGGSSTEADPSHTYASAGTYTAYLTVSDGTNQVSASLPVVVDPGLVLDVQSLRVKYKGHPSTLGDVKLGVAFTGPAPAGDDVVAVFLDGIGLFSAPFSAFEPSPGAPGAYRLRSQGLFVRLDLSEGTVSVTRRKVDLATLDTANGVDLELHFGDAGGMQTVPLQGDKGPWLEYQPGP